MKVIQLPVSELKSALAGFNKIVSRGTTLPVLDCIRVEPQADAIHLQVTDLDSFATYRTKSDTLADFPPCLISLATLAKVVKTSKDSVALIHEGAERFKVRHFIGTTPVEQSIESLETKEWPPLPEIKANPFLVEPGFKEAFRHAMECASTESTRLVLNGVYMDVTQPDCHCLVGCDGQQLFSANTFHFPLIQSAVIPSRKFINWSGFADDGDWLLAAEPAVNKEKDVVKPAWVQIQSNHWTFLTRGIDAQYPDWRKVMPSPDRTFTSVKLTEKAIGLMLDALPQMPGNDDSHQPVTVIVRPGCLILRSRPRLGAEWAEVPVPGVSVIGASQRVCLNRTFITKALRFGFSEFEVQDALSPVVFTAPGKKLLAMIIHSDDAPATAQTQSEPTTPSAQEATKPTETAASAPRPPLQPDNPTEQKPAMETANKITALPAPERGNLKPTTNNGNNGDTPTALKTVVESVERIKTNLRDMIGDLNDTLDRLKAAEKEKKATLKEVESVRATLRSLQKVEL